LPRPWGITGVAVDPSGNLVIADGGNNRFRVVAVSASDPGYLLAGCPGTCTWAQGDIYTVAGNGTAGYSGDGGPATSAEVSSWGAGIAFDRNGNLVITDPWNCRVREVLVRSGGTTAAQVPATQTLTAGTLQVNSVGAISFGGLAIDGRDQVATATSTIDLTDATGSHSGWNVSVTAPALSDGTDTLPAALVTSTGSLVSDNGAEAVPGTFTGVSAPLALSATAEPVASDTDGAGSGNFQVSYEQPVQASDGAGTYSATWTVTLSQLPATIAGQP
jgi:hypothetical protein